MTRDDIIKLARQVGIDTESDTLCNYDGWVDTLVDFAALVAAAEREECIQIVEDEAYQYASPVWAFEIVNDMKARGKQ